MSSQMPTTPTSYPPFRYQEAFEQCRAEAEAIPAEALLPVNVDIPSISLVALGALPNVMRLRPEVALVSAAHAASIDRLERCALAAAHAHTRHLAEAEPEGQLGPLVADLLKTRQLLEHDARALANRGLLDGSRLAELENKTSHKSVAFDVMLRCTLFRNDWPKVQNRTAVVEADLQQAESLADRLANLVASRDIKDPATEATVIRQRMFTLLVTTYDDIRRAIGYIRWKEDDVDVYAPSLYRNNGQRRAKTTDIEPVPTPGPAAGASPGSTPADGSGNAASAPVGMPGSAPFTR